MNLFLDTNVYLGFYKLSGDDLEQLKKLAIAVGDRTTTLLLTEQTRDEFERNREKTVADSLDYLQKAKLPQSYPRLIQSYDEYDELRTTLRRYEELRDALLVKAREEAATRSLHADSLIAELWDRVSTFERTPEALAAARIRVRLGNPPGKEGSFGDAINWEILLSAVPDGEDLFVVSADSDYRSALDDKSLGGFLQLEWEAKKKSRITLYPSLSALFKEHYPDIQLASELQRELAVAALAGSGSFSTTHAAVAGLATHTDFTDSQVQALVDAAHNNSQVRWILGDRDVREFFERLLANHRPPLSDESAESLIELIRSASGEVEEEGPDVDF